MAEKRDKSFKVFYDTRSKLIRYRSYNEFINTCKDRFNIRHSTEVIFTLAEDNTEVDEDCFEILEKNKTLLLIIREQHVVPEANIELNKPKPTEATDRLVTSDVSTPFQDQNITQIAAATNVNEVGGAKYHPVDEGDTSHETGSEEYVSVRKDLADVMKREWNAKKIEDILKEKEFNDLQLEESFKKDGLQGLVSKVKGRLDNWQNEVVNIAIIGRTGVGKSTFINAIRGDLDENHPDFAKTGHDECTFKREPFQHPDNDRLIFWDLPGVGTDEFPLSNYLQHEDLKISSYDAYILMTSDRFTKADGRLANEIKKMGKMLLFVRSKVDNQIESDKQQKKKAGKVSDTRQVVENIRQNCRNKLKVGEYFEDIYLINSFGLQDRNLDFDKLLTRLVKGFPALKAESLMCTLRFNTLSFLEEKGKYFQKRIWKIALLASISGLVRVSGTCTCLFVNIMSVAVETRLYRKYLGLTEDSLKELEDVMKMPTAKLAKKFSLKSLEIPSTERWITAMLKCFADKPDNSAIMVHVPLLPDEVALSFSATATVLNTILSYSMNDAKVVLNLMENQTGRKVHLTNE